MIGSMDTGGPLIVLAAGGTGGHVFPAEALAQELSERGCRLALVTDRRGGDLGGRLGELETHRVRAGGIAGKGPVARLRSAAEIAFGTLQARQLLKSLKPSVVVGFGGYASVPTMLAATYSTVSTAIHEQNAVLGRANRLLALKVQTIATSYEKVSHIPETAVARAVFTGMPVRAAVKDLHGTPYPPLSKKTDFNILVFGGSQGASVFSRVVPQAIERLQQSHRERLKIVQQCRPEDYNALSADYDRLGLRAEIAPFFRDIPHRIALSHLVISRSGASTVAEVTAIGRPAILVPYPHAIDDHQAANAHAMDEVGGGWLIPDEAFTAESLAHRLRTLLDMPRSLQNAAEAAKRAGRAEAGAALADLVLRLVLGNDDQLETREEA